MIGVGPHIESSLTYNMHLLDSRDAWVIGVTNQHGKTHHFERGPTGEVEAEVTWGGQRKRYQRDALGRVTSRRHANGKESGYSYDAQGRVTLAQHSDAETERDAYGG